MRRFLILLVAAAMVLPAGIGSVAAVDLPSVVPPNLAVRIAASGLDTPIGLAFLGPGDMLITEKATGRVRRFVDGAPHSTVLDLAVNSASERGLLGIALHPDFPADPGVYLFWTESTTGSDTDVVSNTPLLGNRVDRFVWDGSTLSFDRSIIRLRALQHDSGQSARGNHNGGVIRFGADGKLHVFVGDVGRRGQLQNLSCGPTASCPGATVADDAYGGPAPGNAHLTGVVLRLNDDGTTPSDNPFHAAGAAIGGEVGANVQRIYSYGHRNAIGMAFDPKGGALWLAENGDDAFSELNRVVPGMNGGWIQVMGPISRIAEYKGIETSMDTDPVTGGTYHGLQQIRWPPENLADAPQEAQARLHMLPGARYRDPVLSWVYEVAPGGLGFLDGPGLGSQFDGDLLMGAASSRLQDGQLFRVRLAGDRARAAVDDPRLDDAVADNAHKYDVTESESLLFGRGFGVTTDIRTGPNGNLFVVSLTHGAVFEIFSTSPDATDDAYTTPFETPLTVPAPGVLANDHDRDGTPLAAEALTGPASGSLALEPDGSFTYTPVTGFSGEDSFTYAAVDGQGDRDTAVVTITVKAPSRSDPPPPLVSGGDVVRLSGRDRFATGVDASARLWPRGADTVVIATGQDYPDALAGGPVAARNAGPLLLATTNAVPRVVLDELVRLAPQEVILLGGTAAISAQVEQDLGGLPGAPTVTRIGGRNRFETAEGAAEQAGRTDRGDVVVATGQDYPDALSAGSLTTGVEPVPVTLAVRDRLMTALRSGERALLIGGLGVLDADVEEQAHRQAAGLERLSGANRFATSQAVADFALRHRIVGQVPLIVATGQNYPDALSAGAVTARTDGPLLLVPATGPTPAQVAWVTANRSRFTGAIVMGGTAAVSEQGVAVLRDLLRPGP